jgi:hypothetical protein
MTYQDAAPRFEALAGITPSRPTFSRWCRLGVTVNGRVVKLAGRRVGARWVVSDRAISSFLAELAAAAG